MGRVSQTQAQENRKRVVATAARMFREKGTAVSVADVMKAAGLTHGGFYKHFASKEDLIDEATAYAFDEPAAQSAMSVEEHAGKPEAARRRMIEGYLSVWHRDHAGDGCAVSGFAADTGARARPGRRCPRPSTSPGYATSLLGWPPATTTVWPSCAPWSAPSSSPAPPRVTRSPKNCYGPRAQLSPTTAPDSPNRSSARTDRARPSMRGNGRSPMPAGFERAH